MSVETPSNGDERETPMAAHDGVPRTVTITPSELRHATLREPLDFLSPATKTGALGRLAHYDVLEVLGKGGFGIVLKALDDKLRRIVALKVLAPVFASDGLAHERFLREAQAAAAVRHEHVVTIYAVEEQPVPFLALEYISGPTLQDKLDRCGPLPTADVLRLGKEIAAGLAAAHAQGIVHRDVKPRNILLEGAGERVKITDFGLARAVDDDSVTQSGVAIGTPAYMSPEQADGLAVDHRSDLFSLGTVLYVMCTGRPPFHASGTMAVLRRIIDETPPPIRATNPDIPQWLDDIIIKLHAKKPEDRYQSTQEVVNELARRLAEETGRKSAVVNRTPETATALFPGAIKRRARPSRLLIGIAALGAFAALLAVVLFWNRSQQPTEKPSKAAGQTAYSELPKTSSLEKPAKDNAAPISDGKQPLSAVAPFDADKAKAYQQAWAKHLGVDAEITNSIGMKLRLIPPGAFTMGSTPQEIDGALLNTPDWNKPNVRSEGPTRSVPIERAFYLGIHEVTVGQFRQFVKEAGHQTWAERTGKGGRGWDSSQRRMVLKPGFIWSSSFVAGTELHPVVLLHREDVLAFCAWLSKNENRTYVLPTEEQWEFACRAGAASRWFWGDDETQASLYCWCEDPATSSRVMPVGLKLPNPFGLYDMPGNAAELALDAKGAIIMRGGHAGYSPDHVRSAAREIENHTDPTYRNGFRVAIVIAAK